jgi:hypothetical protein
MVQIRAMYDLVGERYASPEGSDHLGRTISVRGNLKPIADSLGFVKNHRTSAQESLQTMKK